MSEAVLTTFRKAVLLGGDSEWEPPESISNSEVKTLSADDSVGLPHVKIGHCQASNYNPPVPELHRGVLFLCGFAQAMWRFHFGYVDTIAWNCEGDEEAVLMLMTLVPTLWAPQRSPGGGAVDHIDRRWSFAVAQIADLAPPAKAPIDSARRVARRFRTS